MRSHKTQIPPTLREIDGQWFVVVTGKEVEILAPVGSWFAAQFFSRVVLPTLILDAQKNA